jgi:NADPH:quinone reductase-like Zn-dependent oxidoreductase
MKAFVARSYGGPEVMGLASIADPVPRRGQIVVEVHASSVNPLDWMLRNGVVHAQQDGSFPKVFGADFSGTVEAVGEGVTRFVRGTAVYGNASPMGGGQGAHAERVAVAAERVHRMPPGLSYEEAAALPVAALTALDGLRQCGDVRGKTVLVNGATGGVGHLAVQIAHARGAMVTAVCSAAHADRARELGAVKVIDFEVEDFTRSGRRYDVVFDAHGALRADSVARILAQGGQHVTTLPVRQGIVRSFWRRFSRGPSVLAATPRDRDEDYAVLARLIAVARIRPTVAEVFPLERAGEAFAAQESGRAVGKVVIRVVEPDESSFGGHLGRLRLAVAEDRPPAAAAG